MRTTFRIPFPRHSRLRGNDGEGYRKTQMKAAANKQIERLRAAMDYVSSAMNRFSLISAQAKTTASRMKAAFYTEGPPQEMHSHPGFKMPPLAPGSQ